MHFDTLLEKIAENEADTIEYIMMAFTATRFDYYLKYHDSSRTLDVINGEFFVLSIVHRFHLIVILAHFQIKTYNLILSIFGSFHALVFLS